MIIEVTQDHIDNGTQEAGDSCAIALALEDAGFSWPDVNTAYVFVEDEEGHALYFRVTKSIQEFIDRFDAGKPVRPTKFRLIRSARPW